MNDDLKAFALWITSGLLGLILFATVAAPEKRLPLGTSIAFVIGGPITLIAGGFASTFKIFENLNETCVANCEVE